MRHVHTRREHTLETTHLASGKRQARGEAHQAELLLWLRLEADHTLGFRQEAGKPVHTRRDHTLGFRQEAGKPTQIHENRSQCEGGK